MEDERKLIIEYLEKMKEEYIEGEGYERHPLPEWYALDKAIEELEQESCEDAVSRDAIRLKIAEMPKYTEGKKLASIRHLENFLEKELEEPIEVTQDMCIGFTIALKCIGKFIKALPPVTSTQSWIPIVRREPTQEEKDEYFARNDEELCFMVESEMPENGQEVLVSSGGYVSEDVFDEDYYSFENHETVDVDAWMPKPKAYKAENKKGCNNLE